MITTLKYANKVFALTLLLAILVNITVPGILPSINVQAKPEAVEAGNCVLYPMAFSAQSFAKAQAGSIIEINAVDQPGGFSWLTWTGNPNANLLAASLTLPGNSSTYVNPDDPKDNVVSTGDWVKGVPGVVNSNAVGEALKLAVNNPVVVPLFDSTRGDGSNRAIKIAGFARVKLINFEFPKGNHITIQYLDKACETVSLTVGKTVSSATLPHSLNASLTVDKETAIPGDTLTYTTTITETTSDMAVAGTFTVTNNGDSQTKIASFYDLIDFKSASTGAWTNLAGTGSGLAVYTPVSPAPLNTGMTLTLESVPAVGVTYAAGNAIAGTVLSGGSTAAWKYTAVVSLPAEQLTPLLDNSLVSQVRNKAHFELAPAASESALTYDAEVDFTKTLQNQISASTALSILLTLPDGSTVSPSMGAFAVGGPLTAVTSYKVPALTGKGVDETEADYLDRLALADGSVLKATLDVTTQTGSIPQSVVNTTLQVPIVTIQKNGPVSVEPGQTFSYDLALTNSGSAPSGSLLVMDLMNLDGGTYGAVSGLPGSLASGGSATAQSTFNLPLPDSLDVRLPALLTDVASVNWLDANGNFYGQLTDFFTSEVVSPYSSMTLKLSPAAAGPNLTGSQQTLTATLLDQQQNPVPGVKVFFVIEGANLAAVDQVTGADGTAVVNYTGAAFGYDTAKAYVITGLAPLESNTSTIHWVTPKFTVTTSVVRGRFFAGSDGGSFNISKTTAPVFEEYFPNLNFNNGDSRTGNIFPEVSGWTKPITDVTLNVEGKNAGNIQAHFADYTGIDSGIFSAVFTGQFYVTTAGEFTFTFRSDDGYIFGLGNGAKKVGGSDYKDPLGYTYTPFENYPVMGAYNAATSASARTITVNFPAPGVYPFEIDYTDGGGWQRALIVADTQTGLMITPATALTITPFSGLTSKVWPIDGVPGTPQVFTARLVDASGLPMAGVQVTFRVRGLNAQEYTTVTDSNGQAVFTLTSSAGGVDYVQATATVDGKIIAVSAEPTISW